MIFSSLWIALITAPATAGVDPLIPCHLLLAEEQEKCEEENEDDDEVRAIKLKLLREVMGWSQPVPELGDNVHPGPDWLGVLDESEFVVITGHLGDVVLPEKMDEIVRDDSSAGSVVIVAQVPFTDKWFIEAGEKTLAVSVEIVYDEVELDPKSKLEFD